MAPCPQQPGAKGAGSRACHVLGSRSLWLGVRGQLIPRPGRGGRPSCYDCPDTRPCAPPLSDAGESRLRPWAPSAPQAAWSLDRPLLSHAQVAAAQGGGGTDEGCPAHLPPGWAGVPSLTPRARLRCTPEQPPPIQAPCLQAWRGLSGAHGTGCSLPWGQATILSPWHELVPGRRGSVGQWLVIKGDGTGGGTRLQTGETLAGACGIWERLCPAG